jgi:hypothetical protein
MVNNYGDHSYLIENPLRCDGTFLLFKQIAIVATGTKKSPDDTVGALQCFILYIIPLPTRYPMDSRRGDIDMMSFVS